MAIRAKFKVDNVQTAGTCESVVLSAVYSSDPDSENKSFSEATPSGTLTMAITNTNAHGFFVQGQEYYLDLTPAAQAAPADTNVGDTKAA